MDLEKVFHCLNKFGVTLVICALFLYQNHKTTEKYDKLQEDFRIAQREDRDAYVATLGSVVETLDNMNVSISVMGTHMKAMETRVADLEKEIRNKKMSQTTIVGNNNNNNREQL